MQITYSTAKALIPTAVALGNFDGLHRGHQRVIQPVLKTRREAGELLAPSEAQVYATVVTFNPHPQEFFTGQPRALLTPLPEKVQQLISWKIEQLVLLPFDRELAALSPSDFVEKILVQLQAQMISVGEDFRFGKQRCGTAADLQAIAAKFGIPVTIVPNYTCEEGERISSSAIRQALTQGDLQRAKVLLDRPYTLTGTVVKGQQLGRTIGFPTANIQLPANKFVPRQGVYAVRVFMEKARESVSSCPLPIGIGVMNIGYRPTVNGSNQSVEVHLLDWSGDLYDKTITVQLEEFLRPEQKFSSLEDLKSQIAADCDRASSLEL